ncbi:MFS transporter [Acinetobacter radioresistens]|uniref:MFS transporter n=1 Tax=Acinetobacter radioresistens TaxID=40216 RepID=UPI00254E1194|nr:MFS transporter [Acinetobacter radioresistens]MDK8756465.1 MFS transporter [Acinetobacter radioresistens]
MILFSRTAVLDSAAQLSAQRLSTRLNFFSLGFGTAAWAPLIPFAQQRLNLNHADFGLLLLCMGIGSMIAMPATGALVQRIGCRAIIGFAALLILLVLPGLAVWNTSVMMAVSLFLFGTAAGSFGVALNLQAVIVEKNSLRAMMSSFHGMCSLGGLAGVMTVTALLAAGVSPLISALAVSIMLLVISIIAVPASLSEIERDEQIEADTAEHKKSHKKLPAPIILLIGLMCFIAFLSEGAAMDWSGIYLTSKYGVNPAFAGLAYTFFAIAMTLGRFSGRYLLKILGEKNIVTYSAICAATGLAVVVLAPHWFIVLLGYALVGLGCSNIVPVMFSRVGRQNFMPKAAALSCVSTMAYTGSLSGPALIGVIGEMTGLTIMFASVAVLLATVAILNRFTRVGPA